MRAACGLSIWALNNRALTAILIACSQPLCPRAAVLSGLGLETVRVTMVAISKPSPLVWNTDCHDGLPYICVAPGLLR